MNAGLRLALLGIRPHLRPLSLGRARGRLETGGNTLDGKVYPQMTQISQMNIVDVNGGANPMVDTDLVVSRRLGRWM